MDYLTKNRALSIKRRRDHEVSDVPSADGDEKRSGANFSSGVGGKREIFQKIKAMDSSINAE